MPPDPRIAVVDYGAGNLRSVAKALERAGLAVEVTGDATAVAGADAVVLPGVGAFADAMGSLAQKGLDDALRRVAERGTPYLGLCLGLQVLFDESDEHGVTAGLGLMAGRVERFPAETDAGERLRVPHIGWNTVRWSGDHPVIAALPASDCYYFVHSYRPVPADGTTVCGEAEYGSSFAAAVAREGLVAVQFHPEKSQRAGARLLDAFAHWVRSC